MAWGGGTYLVENKILPGAYFKFESQPETPNIFGERGRVAIAAVMDWAPTEKVLIVEREDFLRECEEVFGHAYDDPEMRPWRELFYGADRVYIYRMGSPTKAENKYATAKYGGKKGNDIKISIAKNIDDENKWDVVTSNKEREVDRQTVKAISDLKSNKWVDFKSGWDLTQELGLTLTGGTNGAANGTDHQNALKAFECMEFDILACTADDSVTKKMYAEWTKRMVNGSGSYHQLVVGREPNLDSEYVISVYNHVKDAGAPESALVWYTAGLEAGCAVNKDVSGFTYYGEYEVDTDDLGKRKLEELIQAGYFVYHKADNEILTLIDQNTFTSFVNEKGEDFKYNQCMRVLIQRAKDVQKIFTKFYLGKAGTDEDARLLFKNSLVKNIENGMLAIRAISGYSSDDTVVEAGIQPRSFRVRERLRPNMAVLYLYHDIIVTREGDEA